MAINSYRAGGGGNHLTDGAGLSVDELKQRQVSSTDKDLRYYLMNELRSMPVVKPEVENNWSFIPADRYEAARNIDFPILFGPGSSKNQK